MKNVETVFPDCNHESVGSGFDHTRCSLSGVSGRERHSVSDAAERDIEEGYLFYEKKSPALGSYFLDSIYSDIDSLSYFGGIHSLVFGYHRLLSKRFPFAVITE